MYSYAFLRKLLGRKVSDFSDVCSSCNGTMKPDSNRISKNMRLLKRFWHFRKVSLALKIMMGILLVSLFITPLRNIFLPAWLLVFKDVSTLTLIRIYIQDWFFYVDTSQYNGPCDAVYRRLATIRMPKLEEMAVYDMDDWNRHMMRIKPALTAEEFDTLDKFKPSMSKQEQRYIMYAMLSATQAMTAFNITYLVRGGSLIGYWRHHGRMPWDEDVDILINSQQWPLARTVLSCLPDLQINLGSEYMWKLFHKDAELWDGEDFIRFPYVDLFLYRDDAEHIWPLTIWMKLITMKTKYALPPSTGVFEGWPISIPNNPSKVLHELYPGRIMNDCYSQIFHRRKRMAVPHKHRVYVPCSLLRGIYPLVQRTVDKGMVLEERMLGSKVLSSFKTKYHGFLE